MMRLLGLDVGQRTIGIAVSDLLGLTAQGLKTIRREDIDWDLQQLKQLVVEYEVYKLVVGFPKNMDGSIGPQARAIQELAVLLQQELGLPVDLWDERLTTVAAERALLEADVSRKKRRRVIDQLAAVLMLQGYLDAAANKKGIN